MNGLRLIKGGVLAMAMPVGLLVCLAVPAAAQNLPVDPSIPDHIANESADSQGEGLEDVGRTTNTGIGEVGQRTEVIVNANPMGRLNSRVRNRIQNRIRNRIDRDYDPMSNTTSPFEEADQEARKSQSRWRVFR